MIFPLLTICFILFILWLYFYKTRIDYYDLFMHDYLIGKVIETNVDMSKYAFNHCLYIYKDTYYEAIRWDKPLFKPPFIENLPKNDKVPITKENPSILEIRINKKHAFYKMSPKFGYQDPRIFLYQGDLFIICYKTNKEMNDMIIFPIHNPEMEIMCIYENRKKIEKNWIPFEWENQLYILYSFSPFILLTCNIQTGICQTIKEFDRPKYFELHRLGSVPFQFSKNLFLFMGHTRHNYSYRNFFFTLDMDRMIPSFPSRLFSIGNHCIQYGTGMTETIQNHLLLTFGIDDCYSVYLKVPKQIILNLIPDFGYESFLNWPIHEMESINHLKKYCYAHLKYKNDKYGIFHAQNVSQTVFNVYEILYHSVHSIKHPIQIELIILGQYSNRKPSAFILKNSGMAKILFENKRLSDLITIRLKKNIYTEKNKKNENFCKIENEKQCLRDTAMDEFESN